MPELAEIARIVHHLRANLRNATISKVTFPQEDPIIFQTPKTGLTIESFAKQLQGRTIVDAQQQGKYFWLVTDDGPHPLMHFGMTGWVRFRGNVGAGVDYKRMQDGETRKQVKTERSNQSPSSEPEVQVDEEWPPRFWKFQFATTSDPPVQCAFVDGRRLGRVRLLDCKASEIRNVTPLKENGPDPVVDADRLTLDFIASLTQKRKVPIKSLLLDQGAISGIGNWMADEILYQAAIHPEQYANTLSESQVKQLHDKIGYVCKTAVDLLADSSKFPQDWIMKWRWDKGKKDANTLPNGEKITHITVGGRTSAIVASRQKKSGALAKDENDADAKENDIPKRKKGAVVQKRKALTKTEDKADGDTPSAKVAKKGRKEADRVVRSPGARRSSRRSRA